MKYESKAVKIIIHERINLRDFTFLVILLTDRDKQINKQTKQRSNNHKAYNMTHNSFTDVRDCSTSN